MELVRYVLPHFCAGTVAGIVLAFGLIATNPPLQALLLRVDGGWLGLLMLIFGCVGTLAPAAAGYGVMQLGQLEE